MEFLFQLLDADYSMVGDKPVVRLFGKCDDQKTVCVFIENFHPYFYILPMEDEKNLKDFLNKKFGNEILKIEKTEKFLAHNYQKNKTKLLKIICKDPSKVPDIRTEVWREGLAKKIFEADILFKYRYMSDKDLHGMRWYKVSGNPVNTTTVKTDRAIELKKIEPAEERKPNLKIMSVDIEIATPEGVPDSQKDPIIMISLGFLPQHNGKNTTVFVSKPMKKKSGVLSFKNEEEMLKEFSKMIEKYDPDIIVGYNINNFDMPYILDRLAVNNIPRSIGRNSKPAIYRKIAGSTKNYIPGRVIVDDYLLIKEMQVKTQLAEKGFPKLKRYGLDDVSRALLNESKIDVTHKEIPKLWNGKEEETHRLIDYSRKDAELAMKLLVQKNLLDKFLEISKVSGLLLQDVLDSGEAARVENMMLKELNKRDFVLPLKPSSNEMIKRLDERDGLGFKGALVLEPVTGLHTKPVVYLDFKSMYPTIFISFNICPTTLVADDSDYSGEVIETPLGAKFVSPGTRKGIVPQIVQYLIGERDRLRKEAKNTKDDNIRKILESKQIAVKYMTNSFYGYTGYIRARTYNLNVATAVTGCGRMLIEKTRDTIEKHKKAKVIYGDTDSVMAEVDAKDFEQAFEIGTELEKEINSALQGKVTMKIESVFTSLLILSKKRYAGISMEPRLSGWEEKTVMKGIETIRRDWCDLTSETLNKVLDIILKEKEPKRALEYVKEIVKDLSRNKIPIDKLIITKSVSKSLKDYKGVLPHIEVMKKMRKRDIATAPVVGDRIGYVIVDGTQLMSMRAEDPGYVKSKGLKVDAKYYIENQLVPPLERVFDAIGISKSEILNAGKLMSIMEFMKPANKVEKKSLDTFEGIVCDRCNQLFRRPPLIGKCDACGGPLSFYSGESRAKLATV